MFKPGDKVRWHTSSKDTIEYCDGDPCRGIMVESVTTNEGAQIKPNAGQSFVLWTDVCFNHISDKWCVQNVANKFLKKDESS